VGSINRKTIVQISQGINTRPISKITNAKRVGGVTQLVELLPCKCKVLHPKPSTGKKILAMIINGC
jgi:hypothetical protein